MAPQIRFIVTAELESSLDGALLNGGVSPALPGGRVLPYGYRTDIVRRDGVVTSGTMVPAPVWLITGARATILVDTGVDDVDEVDQLHVRYAGTRWAVTRGRGQDLSVGLAELGLKPSDIEIVVLSHLHFDHIGNNELFTRARFYVQRDEPPQAMRPPRFSLFYYPEYARKMTAVMDRVELVDGDIEIDPDVRLLKIGGHTPGCMATLVNTSRGRVCLTSDTMYNYRNIEFDWPVGSCWDLRELLRGYNRMRAEADILVPQHDWQLLEMFPQQTIG